MQRCRAAASARPPPYVCAYTRTRSPGPMRRQVGSRVSCASRVADEVRPVTGTTCGSVLRQTALPAGQNVQARVQNRSRTVQKVDDSANGAQADGRGAIRRKTGGESPRFGARCLRMICLAFGGKNEAAGLAAASVKSGSEGTEAGEPIRRSRRRALSRGRRRCGRRPWLPGSRRRGRRSSVPSASRWRG